MATTRYKSWPIGRATPSIPRIAPRACHSFRHQHTSSPPSPTPARDKTDVHAILAKPTWSVRSLLPSSSSEPTTTPTITKEQLHHLLRLSALTLTPTPEPRASSADSSTNNNQTQIQQQQEEEEQQMIRDLQAQLHFVRAIQSVETRGVEPLRSIRDDTADGRREVTIGLEQLRDVLAQEDTVGHRRRPRRRRYHAADTAVTETSGADGAWDVLGEASRTARGYFVVRSKPTA